MPELSIEVKRTFEKPRIVLYYNQQTGQYVGQVEDESRQENAVSFAISNATIEALKLDMAKADEIVTVTDKVKAPEVK